RHHLNRVIRFITRDENQKRRIRERRTHHLDICNFDLIQNKTIKNKIHKQTNTNKYIKNKKQLKNNRHNKAGEKKKPTTKTNKEKENKAAKNQTPQQKTLTNPRPT
ncbi:hypothetical protein ACQWHW_24380, partial [Salmonella enterica subsp. enterica serovar Infantis]